MAHNLGTERDRTGLGEADARGQEKRWSRYRSLPLQNRGQASLEPEPFRLAQALRFGPRRQKLVLLDVLQFARSANRNCSNTWLTTSSTSLCMGKKASIRFLMRLLSQRLWSFLLSKCKPNCTRAPVKGSSHWLLGNRLLWGRQFDRIGGVRNAYIRRAGGISHLVWPISWQGRQKERGECKPRLLLFYAFRQNLANNLQGSLSSFKKMCV